MSVDAHFFYYNFEDYFLRVLLSLSLGYDVVVPVRRIGSVQYKTIRLKEKNSCFMADILLFLVSIMMLNTGNPVIREDPSPGFVNKSEKYIIIEAYDARMLDAEKKGTRFNTAVYELDSVNVTISSKKRTENLFSFEGNTCGSFKDFRSSSVSITATRNGYKPFETRWKLTGYQQMLQIFMEKEDL